MKAQILISIWIAGGLLSSGCRPKSAEKAKVYWGYQFDDVTVERSLSAEQRDLDAKRFANTMALQGDFGWELVTALPLEQSERSARFRFIYKKRMERESFDTNITSLAVIEQAVKAEREAQIKRLREK